MSEKLNKNPLVSVIMPVYNCAQYVDEAIESMVNQKYTNMEIIIIDDCSTDGTTEKIEKWSKRDIRIKPIYKSVNSGYVDSLNMAIGLSNGEYIARMDGDDISLPERIEKQAEFMQNNLDVGVLGAAGTILGQKFKIVPQTAHYKIKIGLLAVNQMIHPTVMFRSSVLKSLDRFYNKAFMPAEDYEFWIFLVNKTKFANLSDDLLAYRIHGNNISFREKSIEQHIEMLKLQLINLDKNVTDGFVLKFFNTLNKTNTLENKKESMLFLKKCFDLLDANKQKKHYDIKEFRAFILHISAKVVKKAGRKYVLISSFRDFTLLVNVMYSILLSLKRDNYDYCRCNWNEPIMFD